MNAAVAARSGGTHLQLSPIMGVSLGVNLRKAVLPPCPACVFLCRSCTCTSCRKWTVDRCRCATVKGGRGRAQLQERRTEWMKELTRPDSHPAESRPGRFSASRSASGPSASVLPWPTLCIWRVGSGAASCLRPLRHGVRIAARNGNHHIGDHGLVSRNPLRLEQVAGEGRGMRSPVGAVEIAEARQHKMECARVHIGVELIWAANPDPRPGAVGGTGMVLAGEARPPIFYSTAQGCLMTSSAGHDAGCPRQRPCPPRP